MLRSADRRHLFDIGLAPRDCASVIGLEKRLAVAISTCAGTLGIDREAPVGFTDIRRLVRHRCPRRDRGAAGRAVRAQKTERLLRGHADASRRRPPIAVGLGAVTPKLRPRPSTSARGAWPAWLALNTSIKESMGPAPLRAGRRSAAAQRLHSSLTAAWPRQGADRELRGAGGARSRLNRRAGRPGTRVDVGRHGPGRGRWWTTQRSIRRQAAGHGLRRLGPAGAGDQGRRPGRGGLACFFSKTLDAPRHPRRRELSRASTRPLLEALVVGRPISASLTARWPRPLGGTIASWRRSPQRRNPDRPRS